MALFDRPFSAALGRLTGTSKPLPHIDNLALLPGARKSLTGIYPGGDSPAGSAGGMATGYGAWSLQMPSTRLDYRREAGDLTQNAIIMACIQWICRTFPEAPIRVVALEEDGQSTPIPKHPLTELLKQPNPYYNGLLLWQATLLSWNIAGDAYWLRVRNNGGQLKELWWEPHTTCRPIWPSDGSEFISGYQVLRGGHWQTIDREDVIHFRNGIDPTNPRQGLAPLAAALREVFTDNEAAAFSATLLRNMGVPGVIVSPALENTTIDDPEGLKRALISKLSGDRRGEPLIMEGPTKMEVLSWSPEQMNLDSLRTIPEERITALLGVPAIVAGLGAGLDHSTFHNYGEAKASAYENNLLPTQRLLAAQLNTDLLPELGNPDTEEVEFDISEVQALSEDQNEMMARMTEGYQKGILKRGEARTGLGMNLDVDDDDDVYFTDLVSKRATMTEAENPGQLLGIEEPIATEGDQAALPPPTPTPAPLPPLAGKSAPQRDKRSADEDEADRLMEQALAAKFGTVLASKKSGSNGH